MAKLRKIIEKSDNAIHFHHTTATHITTIPPYFVFYHLDLWIKNTFYSLCSSFFLLYNQTAKTNVPAIIRHILIVSDLLSVNPVPQKGPDGNDSITAPFADDLSCMTLKLSPVSV